MGRVPCCDHESSGLKRGPWTPEEDKKLVDYITKNGHGSWRSLPKLSGLNRCGKSCRLRWTNYLRPDIKRGQFSDEEERIIINLHSALGNKWSKIANHLPGRTDNEIKNYWNTSLRKKLLQMGIDPNTHKPRTDLISPLHNVSQLLSSSQLTNLMVLMNSSTNWHNALKLQPQTTSDDQMVKIQLLQNLFQAINSTRNSTSASAGFLGPQNLNPIFEACTNNNNINANNYQIGNLGFAHNCINGTADQSRPIEHLGSWERVKDIDHEEIINPLPKLVSVPFTTGNTISRNQMGNKITIVEPNCETFFEAWDQLLGNGDTSESYWKDILELMSDPPSV